MRETIEKRIIGLLMLIVLLIGAVTVVAVRNIRGSMASSDWVNHTHAVVSEAEAIVSSMNAAEAALRSFLLGGNERDRAACRRAWAEAVEHLEVAKSLTAAEPAQHRQFAEIESLLDGRVKFSAEAIRTASEKNPDKLKEVISASADANGEIQNRIEKLKQEEQELLRARDRQAYEQSEATRRTVIAASAVNLLVIFFLVFLVKDDLRARRRATKALEDSNLGLEKAVKERTAELEAVNQTLVDENLQQRWSNEALDHQYRHQQVIFNSIDDLIIVISKAANISRVNPAVVKATGLETRELVGKSLQSVLRGAADAELEASPAAGMEEALGSMKSGRDTLGVAGFLKRRGKTVQAVIYNVFPLRDRDRIVGGVVTVRLPVDPEDRRQGTGGRSE